jgi:hypothetical protein
MHMLCLQVQAASWNVTVPILTPCQTERIDPLEERQNAEKRSRTSVLNWGNAAIHDYQPWHAQSHIAFSRRFSSLFLHRNMFHRQVRFSIFLVTNWRALLRAGRSGVPAPVGARFSLHVQLGPKAHAATDHLLVYMQPPVQWEPGLFPGDRAAGGGVNHPSPSSSGFKEKVELYFYTPSGTSRPVVGRRFHLHLMTLIFTAWHFNQHTEASSFYIHCSSEQGLDF